MGPPVPISPPPPTRNWWPWPARAARRRIARSCTDTSVPSSSSSLGWWATGREQRNPVFGDTHHSDVKCVVEAEHFGADGHHGLQRLLGSDGSQPGAVTRRTGTRTIRCLQSNQRQAPLFENRRFD